MSTSTEFKNLWKKIGTHGVMTLSACSENRVTSRPMSVVVINGRFYCQTDETYLKCKQISDNPNVALCFKNFSIEGVCRIIGRPVEHKDFIESMSKHFRSAVKRYSSLPTECVLEITPTLIYSWNYNICLKPYMEYWDFQNLCYTKQFLYD